MTTTTLVMKEELRKLKQIFSHRVVLLAAVVMMAAMSVQIKAQNFPVSVVSTQDSVKGFQLGIISSVAPDGGRGVQFAGVSNTSVGVFNGLQLGGVTNITRGMNRGLQLSGILNVSLDEMRGWQWGAINYADTLNGVQMGVFNVVSRHPRGWQVGLVNLSYDTIGHKIGLVNVNPNTDIDLMLFGGSANKSNIALRYRNKSTYNILCPLG